MKRENRREKARKLEDWSRSSNMQIIGFPKNNRNGKGSKLNQGSANCPID